ncbi:uncharacterized protein BO66DRAFT_440741 [Aspergillus aculeatinus CBS 121060]|uniref:Uncharacterized protein n=1 Tax=Aspergillus aculeatinus CBS 121060 TaxID=1448322 RepID=A0ACD1H305_9EURO|nr:hypothetical protein BO66DRAFT_440741 [Aspergillus aculeatinus CBS 121060]RAH67805.1 hypothetical protein BO66DRAFT_440741 [Aspergillus aculeatinus CBS 121060]
MPTIKKQEFFGIGITHATTFYFIPIDHTWSSSPYLPEYIFRQALEAPQAPESAASGLSSENLNAWLIKPLASELLLYTASRCRESWRRSKRRDESPDNLRGSYANANDNGSTDIGSVFVDAYSAFMDHVSRTFTGRRRRGVYLNGRTGTFDFVD